MIEFLRESKLYLILINIWLLLYQYTVGTQIV